MIDCLIALCSQIAFELWFLIWRASSQACAECDRLLIPQVQLDLVVNRGDLLAGLCAQLGVDETAVRSCLSGCPLKRLPSERD